MEGEPNINEFGEVTRENRDVSTKPEYPPALQLTILFDEFKGGNVIPAGIENPEALIYFNSFHIEEAKNALQKMKETAAQHDIEFLVNYDQEKTESVRDILERLEKSIIFSENTIRRINEGVIVNESSPTAEELEMKRIALRNKMTGKE